MKFSDVKDIAIVIALGAIIYYLYKSKEKLQKVGEDIGNWFYDLTHEEWNSARFFDDVLLANGITINLQKQFVDANKVFPHMGVLYVLGKDASNNYVGARARAGTRYTWPDGAYVIQNPVGTVTFHEKDAA